MNLKSRIERIERHSSSPTGSEPAAIIIGQLAGFDEASEPCFAYVLAGPFAGGQVNRNDGESAAEFERRLDRIVNNTEVAIASDGQSHWNKALNRENRND